MPTSVTAREEHFLLTAPQTRSEKRSVLFMAGVWLIFFAWTVGGLVSSQALIVWQVLAWISLAAFIVIYLTSFLYPDPITSLPRTANILLYTAVLVGLGLIMVQATEYAIANIVPYLMAVWLFNHRLRTGVVAVAIIAGAVVTIVLIYQIEAFQTWLLPAVGVPTLVLVLVRSSIEIEETSRVRSERLALVEQREELARTVHDVLGHSLTTITVKTQLARRLVSTDPAKAEAELDEILALSRRSLSEVRATVTDLRQPDLTEQLDLSEQSLNAAEVRLHRPEELPQLTLVQQQVFAWVLREAITNVIRHAHAQHCRVRIFTSAHATTMTVDDDGTGYEPSESESQNGLKGLRHRVDSAGGRFNVEQLAPGTRVEVAL